MEKDLKIQALLERIASLTTEYENKVADLRVQLTLLSEELRKATEEKADVQEEADSTARTD